MRRSELKKHSVHLLAATFIALTSLLAGSLLAQTKLPEAKLIEDLRRYAFRGEVISQADRDSAIKSFDGPNEGGPTIARSFQDQAKKLMPKIYPVESFVLGLDETDSCRNIQQLSVNRCLF